MKKKVCSKCKIEKSVDEFHKDNKAKDGLKSNCKECCKTKYYSLEKNKKVKLKKDRARMLLENNKKVCTKCGIEKSVDEFYKAKKGRVGFKSRCKKCMDEVTTKWAKNNKEKVRANEKRNRVKNPETAKAYRVKNKDKIKILSKNNYEKNKDKIKIRNKKSSIKYREINREKLNKYNREYNRKNREKLKEYINIYNKKKRDTDSLFKLKVNIRNSIRNSFRRKGYKKNSKSANILSCSFEEFKLHLEKQFEPWMNWGNHGKYNGELNYGWDMDHIIPLASATTEEEVIKLNHYTNFQPLCSKVNRDIKRDKL